MKTEEMRRRCEQSSRKVKREGKGKKMTERGREDQNQIKIELIRDKKRKDFRYFNLNIISVS